MAYAIAIDGPAGAGKSTIARRVAEEMNLIYIDTGAMYRAMAVYFLGNNINLDNEEEVNKAVQSVNIEIKYERGEQQVILNGFNCTKCLRDEIIGKAASAASRYGAVRTRLVELQRELAAQENVVMDGRDIGTVVLPDAQTKIYLTASVQARAGRRCSELKERGEEPDFELIKKDIEDRDYQDMNRAISPLRQADDAVLLDTSDMSVDEVVEAVKNIAAKSRGGK